MDVGGGWGGEVGQGQVRDVHLNQCAHIGNAVPDRDVHRWDGREHDLQVFSSSSREKAIMATAAIQFVPFVLEVVAAASSPSTFFSGVCPAVTHAITKSNVVGIDEMITAKIAKVCTVSLLLVLATITATARMENRIANTTPVLRSLASFDPGHVLFTRVKETYKCRSCARSRSSP